MNLPSPQNQASHQLGPPFHTLLDSSGRNLYVLVYTGDTTIPDSKCADAIIHALACLIQTSLQSSTGLKCINIPFGPSFVGSSLHPNLLVALPPLGFSQRKPTTLSALATRAYQKRPRKLPSSVRISEVFTPEDLSRRMAIESSAFEYSPSHTKALGLALEYMTYGTAQALDHHYLAWFTPDASADEVGNEHPIAYLTLRVGRGAAYVQGAAVLEPWRRQGITRAMLDNANDVAVELGYEVIGNSAWTEDAAAAWRAKRFEDVGEYTEWTWENKLTAGTES